MTPKPLNDRVGELFFYGVLNGAIPNPPDIYLEVKDKKGNPVEIKLIRAEELKEKKGKKDERSK